MKKAIVFTAIGSMFFLAGCSSKLQMADSVVDLAGNQSVAGWKDDKTADVNNSECKEKVTVKTVVKYEKLKDSDGDWVPDSVDECPNTPPNLTVDHKGCPIITTLRLNFDFNKAVVKEIYYPELKKVADILKNNPHLKIEVAGYTDNVGSEEYNLKLSQKRAQAVRDVLVNIYKADPQRIIAKGYGSKYPLVPNTTPTNRALNRRVEIVDITKRK